MPCHHRVALLALLLLATPAALAQDPPPAPPPGTDPKPKGDPSAGDPAQEDTALLEKLVKDAMPVVERLRGLKFKTPVPVQPVTREQFVERYMKDFTRVLGGEERVAPAGRLLARVGILGEGDDLRALLGNFLQGNIAANYDPQTKKVSFLPGIPRTLPLMVHELTHAVDDQAFDMMAQAPAWSGNFDRALAYGALAEGDAESVETRFSTGGMVANQPLDQLRKFAEAMAAGILRQKFGRTPPALVLAFKSQYTEGIVFAEALRRSPKGNEAVDAAFRSPPASTEQVLHPEKFLAGGDPPVDLVLPAPPEGAKTLISTTLGELGTRIVLATGGIPAKEAAEAAAGWGGDTAALVAFPGGEALLWTTAWDTEQDAKAFYEAMNVRFPARTGEAAGRMNRVLVQRGTTVELVEGPEDCLVPAVEMIRKAERK
jgi:hypothetical protein